MTYSSDYVLVEVARSGAQRSLVCDIRRKVYCDECGWLGPGQVWDQRDDRATVFLAGISDRWQGTVRMLDPGAPFEMESHFDLASVRRGGVCTEVGRLAVLPDRRRSSVAVALFHAVYRHSLSHGIRFLCAAAVPGDRLYLSLGFRQLGGLVDSYPPVYVQSAAYMLDLEAAATRWRQERPRLLALFEQPLRGIG